MTWDVLVIGAGAAGLLAAAEAAARSRRTLLLEKNPRPGVKILMSGGTRCNLTQATDVRGIVRAFGEQGRFLHSALAALSPADLVQLMESEGVPTKVEPTGKIFPVSDRAADVVDALLRRLTRSGAELALAEPVLSVERRDAGFAATTSRRELQAGTLLLTTGGKSYPGSGTTGDGYAWAAALGHSIVPPRPALAPLTTAEAWVKELRGVTLPDVAVEVVISDRYLPPAGGPLPAARGKRPELLAERRGSLLFTHFGLSGPAAMDVSRAVTGFPAPASLDFICDFFPDLKGEALAQQLQDHAAREGKKQLAGILAQWLPRRLCEAILARTGLPPELRGAELSRPFRQRLTAALKGCRIRLSGTRGFGQAEVTAGGVPLDEVNSRTLQSKRTPGLYFAGEILDLDGPIGGYNFQAAFSTGALAGRSV